jgi:hypothetical protein
MPDAHHYIPIAFYLPPIAIIISAAIFQSLAIWWNSGALIPKKKVGKESKLDSEQKSEKNNDSLPNTDMPEFEYLTMPLGMSSFSTLNRPQYIPLLTMALVHLTTGFLFLVLNRLILILAASPSSSVFIF